MRFTGVLKHIEQVLRTSQTFWCWSPIRTSSGISGLLAEASKRRGVSTLYRIHWALLVAGHVLRSLIPRMGSGLLGHKLHPLVLFLVSRHDGLLPSIV